MTNTRRNDLKTMLERRKHSLQNDVYDKMRIVRDDGARRAERVNMMSDPEAGIHEDIDLALIQLNAEIVNRITDALGRLEKGDYGRCTECDEEISEKRLRALPFAARCVECQEAVEASTLRERNLGPRGAAPLFGGSFGAHEG